MVHPWDVGRPHRHAQDGFGLSGGAAGAGWDVWKKFPVYPACSVCGSSCWGGKQSEGATQTGFKFEICPWPTSINGPRAAAGVPQHTQAPDSRPKPWHGDILGSPGGEVVLGPTTG